MQSCPLSAPARVVSVRRLRPYFDGLRIPLSALRFGAIQRRRILSWWCEPSTLLGVVRYLTMTRGVMRKEPRGDSGSLIVAPDRTRKLLGTESPRTVIYYRQ